MATKPRVFVKPLWNVHPDREPVRTSLYKERDARRYETGRGYCVTADSPHEATAIMWKYQSQDRRGLPATDRVSVVTHHGVPVLMDAPRW